MLHGYNFSKLFFVNTSFYVFKCQQFFTFLPGTYTLAVRRTPDQTHSDVTLWRLCDQWKITKTIDMEVQLIF